MFRRRPHLKAPSRLISILLLCCLGLSWLPFLMVKASVKGGRVSSTLAAQTSQMPAHRSEVLVRYRDGVSQNQKDIIAATHRAQRKKQLRGESLIEKLGLTGNDDATAVALQLSLNPAVEFAEPNFLIAKDQVSITANDSRFDEQWALNNTGQNSGQVGSDISVTKAWQVTTGKPATVIAIIDSGVDFTHPDLINNQWTNPTPANGDAHGWDYITDTGDIRDEQGHGTAIAGIIAAEGNNAAGISGVLWRANLMSLRVLDNTGTGDIGSAVEAIDYAVAHGAQVINLSWGTSAESQALKDAIARAIRRDVVVVCSAGNSGLDITATHYYPASFGISGLIAVAGTDNFDRLASWSNWGNGKVMLAAPGAGILTTQMGGGYRTVDGTSASAPLVTGVAGLIRGARPSVNARNVVKALKDGSRKVASLSGKVTSGGVVSASGALEQLHGSPNGSPPVPTRRYGSGGTGPGGSFNTTPPSSTTGAPGTNLPNLDQVRNAKPAEPKARAPIQSNLMCADCDPQGGGGGGGYYPAGDPNFSTARERPVNETGGQGVDIGSRNFNWSLPLLSLPGRAGLDMGLTLSYNSLVWTKDGSYIKFNADLGTPAPGFRLGLPTLQQRFLNSQTGIYAYMMVTPSGGRVELRQVGSSNIYEAQDGSYTQLDVSNPNAPFVRTSDGTQLTFAPVTINSEYRCTQIKDRNGNYISATYDTTNGHLQTITDTLSRVVTFVYDASSNLIAIRQTWAGVAHDWATFSYGQVYVAPAFGGGLLINGANNNYVTVLSQVSLHDGSYFTFNYNPAFGQVNRINHYASDSHLLSYTSYNVDSSAGQTDCPRFTERRDWAENWNNGAEAVTSYSAATDNSWGQQTAPDGTIYKEFYTTSGWQNGLTTSSEIWSGGVKKKWTTTSWTQDDTGLSYQKNPRLTEANIYDAEGNRKRTQIDYTSYNLPSDVYEYAADATTLLRRTHTDYRTDAAFLDRRIIGLPSGRLIYDGSGALVSKITYAYDWSDSRHFTAVGPSTQHDATTYGSGFVYGRGNLTGVGRYNVNAPDDGSQLIWVSLLGYDMAGSVVMSRDGLDRLTSIDYSDSYSDGNNARNTRAYPTKVTDPDNYFSTVQYNYDRGAVTRTEDPKGAVQNIAYDGVGRTDRVTSAVNNAYTRYVYGPTYVQSFSSINTAADNAYAIQVFDGAGRVTGAANYHPGSGGGYSAQNFKYDNLGRLYEKSNPVEINSGWVPTGDDSAWVWTSQTYDWKGRPLLTTNPDGSTREMTYGGCGCAGGEVTTIRDENGRRRKFTKDVLGRLKQVEELNWDISVYATTSYSYNARDQITGTNQAGQTRSFAYDGHGRLQTRTTPEQGATNYSYFADDAVQTITDARNATTTFAYNNRRLPTSITYGVTGNVAATPNVSFAYDAAGNRTSMTDGLGSVSYSYNTLSQLTSETRTFTGVGSFGLSYAYNLAGELTSITNPWSAQVGYSYDNTGRPTAVTGSGYGGVSSYVGSMTYRAFGLKQMAYGNSRTLSLQYDNRLRLTQWDLPGVLRMRYGYGWESTGRVEFVRNVDDETLDRYYGYDHVGRLGVSRSGSEARLAIGEQVPLAYDGPYSHGYQYDQFGNITYREGWGGENPAYTASYTNNRRNGFSYDDAGNLTNDGGQTFTYDATGQQTYASATALSQGYDGNGMRVKKTENGTVNWYLRSTVLGGQVVAEMDASGSWTRGYVYAGSSLLAVQSGGTVNWMHEDPVSKSKRVTDSNGTVVSTVELDPWGGDTNRSSNGGFQPKKFTSYERDGNGSDEAMHRRYNRWYSRFDQPDPYEGSYDLANPQSFNRYAYTQNDPVNFVDPSGLCTFNINLQSVNNLSGDALLALQAEVSRIFAQAGQTAVFGASSGISYNMNLTNLDPASLPTALGSTRGNADGSISNYGATYLTRISQSLARDPNVGFRVMAQHPTNFGTAVGRVVAHEVGHYLLQLSNAQHTSSGLMRAQFRGDSSLFRRGGDFDRAFQFSVMQRLALNSLCEPLTTSPPVLNNSPTLRLIIGAGDRGLSGVIPMTYGSSDPFDVFRWMDIWYGSSTSSGGYGEVIDYQLDPP
jgi:RHS repeat-associated protein